MVAREREREFPKENVSRDGITPNLYKGRKSWKSIEEKGGGGGKRGLMLLRGYMY